MSAELREHYDLVRRQRDDLMRLQLQKERLTAFVVHDLKNPLNSMDLYAQLLLRQPELSQRSLKSIQSIRDEVHSLLRLVLNLLDISKSEEAQLVPNRRDVDVDALMTEVIDALDLRARAAGLRLAHAVEVRTLAADPDLLRRVLENLLDNAIRHAPEESEIRITAAPHEGSVEFRVADTGPGISPELREKIFERFVQLDSNKPNLTRTGRGLGLAFCKLAVHAHGGTIWVEDGSPGTTFCMRLPQ
jgi:signal transduction histidine kinase